MENSIIQLYNLVLNTIPISVTGHHGIDDKLYKFYDNFANSSFFSNNLNYTLLYSAVLRINNSEQLENWDLDNFSKVFYKTFKEGDKREVQSFYIYLLKRLGEKFRDKRFSTSKILSEFFVDEMNFKVSLCDKDSTKPICSYDRNQSLFEIKVPRSIFSEEINKLNNHHLKEELSKRWNNWNSENRSDNRLLIDRVDDSKQRYYSVNNKFESVKKEYDILFKFIFNDDFPITVEEIAKEIFHSFRRLEKYQIFKKNDRILYKKVAYASLAVSFLCLYYESNIEYMLSIANAVYPSTSKEKTKLRNIGGLIIGYEHDYELTKSERVIINLISDRIASAVTGQYLHKENLDLKRTNRRKEMIRKFEYFSKASFINQESSYNRSIMHGTRIIDENHFDKAKEYVNNNINIFGNVFIEYMRDLYSNNNNEYISKYCLVNLSISTNACECGIENCIHEFKNTGSPCHSSIGKMDNVNIPLLSRVFKLITSERNGVVPEILNRSIIGEQIKFEVRYEGGFPFSSLYTKLRNNNTTGDFLSFLFDYFDIIDAHGILRVVTKQEEIELFNSRNMIINNGMKSEIVEIIDDFFYIPPNKDPKQEDITIDTETVYIIFDNELNI